MAEMRLDARTLLDRVFDDCEDVGDLEIVGARFDADRNHVLLDIRGGAVPDAENVVAEVMRRSRYTVRFKAV